MSSSEVLFEQKGAVGEVVLNRPEQLNAMNLPLIDRLLEAVGLCEERSVRAVIIRGEGRCFCAGGDIRFFKQLLSEGKGIVTELPDRLHLAIEKIQTLDKPVIAVVHGASAGAGAALALAADLILASEDATFNLAYARIGLSPDGSSSYFLPKHLGIKKATEIFMLGSTLNAPEAERLGLVNWVVPASEMVGRANEIAGRLAAGPTKVFGRVKRLLQASVMNNLHDQLALESQLICESSGEGDFREGITAFLEKRLPTYKGI